MSEPFKDDPVPASVPDVDAIVRGVRAGVAEQRARGVYTPTELDELRRIEEELRLRPDDGPSPAEDLARLRASSDPLGPHAFASHRAGVGPLVVAAKERLRRLLKPVAAVLLARQAEFDGAAARLLDGAVRGVRSLEIENDALRDRVGELERRDLELRARCDQLAAEIRARRDAGGTGGGGGEPG